MKNRNGTVKLPKRKPLSWNHYDKLPPEIKKLIQECPYRVQIGGVKKGIQRYGLKGYVEQIKKQIADATRRSCAATYGPDHPQSR